MLLSKYAEVIGLTLYESDVRQNLIWSSDVSVGIHY
jgi:hypothetical protein